MPFSVRTKEEHQLYKDLVREATTGRNSATPGKINWTQMAINWDQYVDGVKVFKKTATHLSGYHKIMENSEQKKGHLRQMVNRGNDPTKLHTATAKPTPAPNNESSDTEPNSGRSSSSSDDDEERVAAIARSTLPGPPPYVTAAVLGNATTPRTTLTSTIPGPPEPQ